MAYRTVLRIISVFAPSRAASSAIFAVAAEIPHQRAGFHADALGAVVRPDAIDSLDAVRPPNGYGRIRRGYGVV